MEQKKTVNVLWVSRHNMTPEQYGDLERIAGGKVQLHQYDATVRNAEDLRESIASADIIAVVLPVDIMSQVLKMAGTKPVIQSVNERVPTGQAKVLDNGKTENEYRFVHAYWEQMLKIEIETKRL